MCHIPQEIFVQKKNNTSVDILETEKNIHALVELPGLEKKDIALSCNGWELKITARNVEKIETVETIKLPARVIKKGMKATYQKGILEVVFNKSKKRVLKKE
jgi:HSP20 family protein